MLKVNNKRLWTRIHMPIAILLTLLIFSYQKKVGFTKGERSEGVRFYYGLKTVI